MRHYVHSSLHRNGSIYNDCHVRHRDGVPYGSQDNHNNDNDNQNKNQTKNDYPQQPNLQDFADAIIILITTIQNALSLDCFIPEKTEDLNISESNDVYKNFHEINYQSTKHLKYLFTESEFDYWKEKINTIEVAKKGIQKLKAILEGFEMNICLTKDYEKEKIIKIYESDIRTASFHDSKNMFFRLYPKYKERVLKIIEKCFNDSDKELIEVGGHAVCEFYIQHGKFDNIMSNVGNLNEERIKAILDMAILYLGIGDYRELAKTIILRFININLDLEFPLIRIFSKEYIKLEEDKKFLQEIVGSKESKKIVWSFIHYLEENALSIVDYADIIIKLCENILWMETEELRNQWGIEDEISKLIISLYDETSNSEKSADKQISEKCLELWDIMFERQLGSVREISRKLMER